MSKRIILLSLFVTCIALSLSAQQKRLGVYAAAFYNLENLWDTEDDPDNPGMMSSLLKVRTNGRKQNTGRN